jgi:hypothetical protein
MRKYCDGVKVSVEIWTGLHVLSTPEYSKVVLGMPSTCLSMVPERIDGFYSYSAFESLYHIGRRAMNMNIVAPEIGAVQVPPAPKNGDCLENG